MMMTTMKIGGGKKRKFTDRGELERPIGDRPTLGGGGVCPIFTFG